MSRHVLVVAALAAVSTACSSGDAGVVLSGTLAGAPFAAREAAAFVLDPMTCTSGGFAGRAVAAVEVRFSDVPGMCDLAVDTAFTGVRASARTATIAVVRTNVFGAGPVAAIAPGTYTDEGTHVADAAGVVRFLWTGAWATDATCAPVRAGMYKEPVSGVLVLDEVGPARVRGSARMTFDNGDVLSGSFDVPVCGSSDAAQCAAMKESTSTPVCVP